MFKVLHIFVNKGKSQQEAEIHAEKTQKLLPWCITFFLPCGGLERRFHSLRSIANIKTPWLFSSFFFLAQHCCLRRRGHLLSHAFLFPHVLSTLPTVILENNICSVTFCPLHLLCTYYFLFSIPLTSGHPLSTSSSFLPPLSFRILWSSFTHAIQRLCYFHIFPIFSCAQELRTTALTEKALECIVPKSIKMQPKMQFLLMMSLGMKRTTRSRNSRHFIHFNR